MLPKICAARKLIAHCFPARAQQPTRRPSRRYRALAKAALLARRRREHFALADMVGRADDALGFHLFDEPRRAVVADLQIALHKAGRGLAFAAYQRYRLVIQIVAGAAVLAAERIERAAGVILGDLLDVVGLAMRL